MRTASNRSRALAGAAVAAACVLAGCGSSGSSTSSAANSGKSSATVPAGGATTAGGSSLKVTGTPKFASPSRSEPVRSGTVHIAYRNITINPDTLRVRVGTTVLWTNFDAVEHNVTSVSGPKGFATSNFGQGATVSVKFTRPGTVHYLCTIHPVTMNGTIEVVK
jgi:plastocyanin